MKKVIHLFFLGASLCAAGTLNQSVDLAGLNEMQRFYYEQGAEDAKADAYMKGYRQATEDFKNTILPKYAEKVKAIEAGKYLIKEGKITYPKVFRIKDGSSYRIQIDPPVVEKEFTEKDLFLLPLAERLHEASAAMENKKIVDIADSGAGNGFVIPQKDDTAFSRDSAPEVRKQQMVAHIPFKNEGIAQAINSYNIDYASTKDGYDLYFSNEAEKNDFCTKVTGNPKCDIQ